VDLLNLTVAYVSRNSLWLMDVVLPALQENIMPWTVAWSAQKHASIVYLTVNATLVTASTSFTTNIASKIAQLVIFRMRIRAFAQAVLQTVYTTTRKAASSVTTQTAWHALTQPLAAPAKPTPGTTLTGFAITALLEHMEMVKFASHAQRTAQSAHMLITVLLVILASH
jgi:hypothetical protein